MEPDPGNQNPPNPLGEDDGDGDGAVGDDDDEDDDAEEHCWPFRIRNCSLLDYTSHKLRIYYTNTSLSTLFLIRIASAGNVLRRLLVQDHLCEVE